MKYQWIFFDADETLFSFDSFSGLQKLFANYNQPFGEQEFQEFQSVNKPLWVKYQQGQINAQQLQITRFQHWADKLRLDPQQLNEQYLLTMAEICQPLPNVVESLPKLKAHAKLAIITNGFTAMQQLRLEKTGLAPYFEFVMISEQIGVAKPDERIFQASLEKAGLTDPQQALMVGDTLESDILGATKIGMDSCWFNHGHQNATSISPTYEIQHFAQLTEMLNIR